MVRVIRSYLAGVGAAGSLVLGGALLFVLASAVVGFNGWPKVDETTGPAIQRVTAGSGAGTGALRAAHTVTVSAAVARRPSTAASAAPEIPDASSRSGSRVSRRSAPPSGPARGAGGTPVNGCTANCGAGAAATSGPAHGSAGAGAGSVTGSGGSGRSGSSGGGGLARVVDRVTGAAGIAVSSVSRQAGGALSGGLVASR